MGHDELDTSLAEYHFGASFMDMRLLAIRRFRLAILITCKNSVASESRRSVSNISWTAVLIPIICKDPQLFRRHGENRRAVHTLFCWN